MANLPRTSRQIRRELATISPADIAQITAFVGSLSATGEAISGKSTATLKGTIARELWTAGQDGSRFKWNRAALEFMQGTKPVPHVMVKAAADVVSKDASFKLLDAVLKMGQGKLDIAQWAVEHDRWLKVAHGANSALAYGGFDEMSPSRWQAVSESVSKQYGFSRAFQEDVANRRYGIPGEIDFSEAAVLNRANQYANAARSQYENTLTEAHKESGYGFAKRLLSSADHCEECVAEADAGWRPIDEVAEIGSLQCRSNCWCVLIYSRDGED